MKGSTHLGWHTGVGAGVTGENGGVAGQGAWEKEACKAIRGCDVM